MPLALEIHDSSDWLSTPLSSLTSVDAALRCQICKDFFDTPVITSCSHTFCSICIRRCLSAEGKCPACRSSDQELKLRRNWAIEELVATFTEARENLLKFGREAAEHQAEQGEPPKKRRKLGIRSESLEQADTNGGRTTRSQSRRNVRQGNDDAEYVQDSEDESEHKVEKEGPPPPEPADGLVACPVCTRRMKEAEVFTHLDRCDGTGGHSDASQGILRNGTFDSMSIAYGSTLAQQNQERLPTISYSLLKENALRKKMRELGISDGGTRQLLQKRHTEWLNLWNANCDSRNPKSKRELLRELDMWERTQGGRAPESRDGQGVMSKDFDGTGWSKGHETDFKRLIEEARKKRAVKNTEADSQEGSSGAREQQPRGSPDQGTAFLEKEPAEGNFRSIEALSPDKPVLIDMTRDALNDNETGIAPASTQGVSHEDIVA
ncbi:MAG: hypothetical protein Q9227_005539 [Pyrenula ochraceoflavens]